MQEPGNTASDAATIFARFSSLVSRVPSGSLYHYTSQSGCVGIIESRTIWATKIQYLNDSEELAYSTKLLLAQLEAMEQVTPEPALFFKQVRNAVASIALINVFTASFSEDGDLLSQWRAYCPAEGGYSLGFDSEELRRLAVSQGFTLAPCVYNVSEQIEYIDELLRASFDRFLASGQSGWGGDLVLGGATTDTWALVQFLRVASFLKHPKFAEEREWRIVSGMRSYGEPQVGFRPGKSMITPYFRFALAHPDKPVPLRQLYVGPTPHQMLADQAVRGLLLQSGIGTIGHMVVVQNLVLLSEVPYRAW
jgi:hypothetical protein